MGNDAEVNHRAHAPLFRVVRVTHGNNKAMQVDIIRLTPPRDESIARVFQLLESTVVSKALVSNVNLHPLYHGGRAVEAVVSEHDPADTVRAVHVDTSG